MYTLGGGNEAKVLDPKKQGKPALCPLPDRMQIEGDRSGWGRMVSRAE
jgi:hypothetical protein